jgi:hypothetical protein
MEAEKNSTDNDGEKPREGFSTQLAQIFLLAIPLLSAPVAFYFNSKQASSYSLGLEFLIIGILVLEFLILIVLKSEMFANRGIYSEEGLEDRFEVNLMCDICDEVFRHSLSADYPRNVSCYGCGNSREIQINDTYDGITHTETPSP